MEFAQIPEGLRARLGEHATAELVELANARAELSRWSFRFWFGQVAAMFGMRALLARLRQP